MTPTSRSIRHLGGAVAALAFFTTIWPADRAEPQATDLVVQGRQALDADKADEAITIFEKAVASHPKDPAALAWLGSAQVRKARTAPIFDRPGWVRKGFNTLDEAVERFPNAFIVYMVRGTTASGVPDLFRKAPVAITDLSTVIAMREKDPKAVPDSVMPSVYLHLGVAYKKNGQSDHARAAWEQGRTLYPSAPETPAIEKELRSL